MPLFTVKYFDVGLLNDKEYDIVCINHKDAALQHCNTKTMPSANGVKWGFRCMLENETPARMMRIQVTQKGEEESKYFVLTVN